MAEFQAVASPTVPPWFSKAAKGVIWYAIDMAVFIPLFFLYFLGRGLPQDRVALSTRNSFHIIDFEQRIGVFHEPGWQQAVVDNEKLVDLANFTYLNLHMPLLVGVGFAIFLSNKRKHRLIRNTILLSAFLAIPIYSVFPVTPPRLMGSAGYPIGVFDTIPEEVRTKPGPMANWYAAVPSYHFGWIALAMAGVWWTWRAWVLRGAAAVFGCVMWWAIVVTGNHYFFDMVAGVLMVSLAFRLALAFERWAERNPAGAGRFTVTAGPLRLPF